MKTLNDERHNDIVKALDIIIQQELAEEDEYIRWNLLTFPDDDGPGYGFGNMLPQEILPLLKAMVEALENDVSLDS